ncbi:hypothetical protein [Paraburkholderia bonniea]|uniref:hypothetical protein n=1 Tax=Paraburkholderia bonniea TaxID=2152891 RepID=UPI0012928C6C|nr:hypothetical protein [Paraburkholderia bonniea]
MNFKISQKNFWKFNFSFFVSIPIFFSLLSPDRMPNDLLARQLYTVGQIVPVIKAYSMLTEFPFALTLGLSSAYWSSMIGAVVMYVFYVRDGKVRERIGKSGRELKVYPFIILGVLLFLAGTSGSPLNVGAGKWLILALKYRVALALLSGGVFVACWMTWLGIFLVLHCYLRSFFHGRK